MATTAFSPRESERRSSPRETSAPHLWLQRDMEQARDDAPPRPKQEDEQALARLIRRHDWHLLDYDTWMARALNLVESGVSPDFERAAKYVYSDVLYWSCRGSAGQERCDAAYNELARYLYAVAYRCERDSVEDLVQQTLEKILRTITACRIPGTFLIFALQKLKDVRKVLFRHHAQECQPAQAAPAGCGEQPAVKRMIQIPAPAPRQQGGGRRWEETIAAGEAYSPVVQCIQREYRRRFEHYRQEFLRKHPRAAREVAALWYKYIYDLDDRTIGLLLGATINNLYVLRSRAKEQLQLDPDWQELAREFGFEVAYAA